MITQSSAALNYQQFTFAFPNTIPVTMILFSYPKLFQKCQPVIIYQINELMTFYKQYFSHTERNVQPFDSYTLNKLRRKNETTVAIKRSGDQNF